MTVRLRPGVDLGGTEVRAALVDEATGALVASHRRALEAESPIAVARTVAAAVRQAAAEAGAAPEGLGAVGVALAARCHGASGTVRSAPALGWRDVPLGELLQAELGLPVRVVNDLAAAAWGERAFGAARGADDAVLVAVGAGIGCGLVLGGRLHEGAGGAAGELGHVKVTPRGVEPRRCGCGEWGCLEAYAGERSLVARVRDDLAEGKAGAVLAAAGGDPGRVTAAAVEAAYGAGDRYARELWAEAGELLGTAIANLCGVLAPARLVLAGELLLGCPNLMRISRAHLGDRAVRSVRRGLSVEVAALGDAAGLVGAALLGGEVLRGARAVE